MTFNPFPWYRPSEDPRARRVEALESPGLGNRRTPADRPTFGMILALTAGVGIPFFLLLQLLTGLPIEVWLVAAACLCVLAALAVRRSRATRRRAAARAEQHALRHAAPPP